MYRVLPQNIPSKIHLMRMHFAHILSCGVDRLGRLSSIHDSAEFLAIRCWYFSNKFQYSCHVCFHVLSPMLLALLRLMCVCVEQWWRVISWRWCTPFAQSLYQLSRLETQLPLYRCKHALERWQNRNTFGSFAEMELYVIWFDKNVRIWTAWVAQRTKEETWCLQRPTFDSDGKSIAQFFC